MILCRVAEGRKKLILQAGALHGIKEGSKYEIFDRDLAGRSDATYTAVVVKVHAFTSSLLPVDSDASPFSLPIWYARLVQEVGATFHVASEDALWLDLVLNTENDAIASQIEVVSDFSQPDLILTQTEDTVHFARGPKSNIVDNDIGLSLNIADTVPADDTSRCRHVIESFMRFTEHLMRASSSPDGKEVVSISMKRLEKRGRTSDSVVPVGNELIEGNSVVNLIVDKDLRPRQRPRYGLIFENITDVPLYVYVFHFDLETLAIGM